MPRASEESHPYSLSPRFTAAHLEGGTRDGISMNAQGSYLGPTWLS